MPDQDRRTASLEEDRALLPPSSPAPGAESQIEILIPSTAQRIMRETRSWQAGQQLSDALDQSPQVAGESASAPPLPQELADWASSMRGGYLAGPIPSEEPRPGLQAEGSAQTETTEGQPAMAPVAPEVEPGPPAEQEPNGEEAVPAEGALAPEAEGTETPPAESEPEEEPADIAAVDEQIASTEAELTAEAPAEPSSEEGPPAELRAWRAEMLASTNAIPAPSLGEAAQGAADVRAHGSATRTGRQAARGNLPRQAQAAVRPPPGPRHPPVPPEEYPVPAAPQLVESKSNRPLPDQRMPELQASPRGTMPVVGQRPEPPAPPTAPPAVEGPAGAPPERETDPNQEHVQEIRQAAQEEVPEGEREAPADPLILHDEPPPPPQPLPPAAGVAISAVIAQLLANPGQQAEAILNAARESVYSGKLKDVYPDIGSQELAGLTETLTSELQEVARQAGVSSEELNTKIRERQQELENMRTTSQGEVTTAGEQETESLHQDGQTEVNAISGARQAVDEHTDRQVETAQGENDPGVVRRRQERLKQALNRSVSQQRVAYELTKGRREQQLDRAEGTQILAYRAAVQRDERAATEVPAGQQASQAQQLEAAGLRNWGAERERELHRNVMDLKRVARETADTYRDEVTKAGQQAREMIDDWADQLLGEERSWWEELLELFRSWSEQAHSDAEAWEEVRAGETRTAILVDFAVLNQVTTQHGDAIDLTSGEALRGLTEEQQAVVRAFYSNGPEARNPISAVAAGLRVRLSTQRRPQLVEKFDSQLHDKPDSEWSNLNMIAQTQGSGFDANRIVQELYQAMHGGITGWGTDEARIFAALNNLTPLQAVTVRKAYRAIHPGDDLDEDLQDELSGAEEDRALAQLQGNQALAVAAELHEAMHGGITGLGTDEDVIMRALRNKTAEEREAIIAEYRREYGEDLSAELRSELGDHDLDRANALMVGDVNRADAIAIDQAMRGGITGWGTDEAAVEGVYRTIREDVIAYGASQDPPWTTAQVEAEVARRNLQTESSYNVRYAGDWEPNQESALRQAFRSELSGPELDLTNALADNDLIAADAARIAIEADAIVYSDDDVINGVLERQYERALEEVRRDGRAEMDDLQRRARTEGWDPYRLRDEQRRLERIFESRARERANGYMSQLEDRYDSSHSRWGAGGFRTVIEFNMSGNDREKARDLVAQGGYLSPAQRIHYAVQGAGTEEEEIRRALAGRSPEEIEEIRAEWARSHPGENMDERIQSELSGRDRFDTNMLLRGEPRNAEEEIAQMRERARWELANSAGLGSGTQRQLLIDRLNELENEYQVVTSTAPDSPERRRALERFRQRSGYVSTAVEGYREQVDSVTDVVATTAAVVAAVVVAVVATILTAGAAAPAIAALAAAIGTSTTVAAGATVAGLAAAAALAATVITKQSMLGGAYGWEDLGVDLAVGAVDIAASIGTAGLGSALIRAGRAGRLATMAASRSRVSRVMAHALAEGAEGLVSSFPAGITGNLLNDQNWEHGNPFANIAMGTLVETGMGTFMSAGMGGLGGIRARNAPTIRPGTGDLLAHRGTPNERLAQWRAYQAQNPGANQGDFLRHYDAGVAQRLADETASQQLRRRLRGQLLDGLPPAQRGVLGDVPLEVLSESDFARLARGQTGPAAFITVGGQTRLVIREGTDPRTLRGEAQSLSRGLVRDARGRPVQAASVLPRDLRRTVPVQVDPNLAGNTVRVHYHIDPRTGRVGNLRMLVGPTATAADIQLHVRTTRLMRRYAGFSGQAIQLLDRLQRWIGRNGAPPPGTRAWEARLEVDKLPRIIQDRMAQLQNASLDLPTQRRLLADVADLQRQLNYHRQVLRDMEMDPGRGFVAAEGISTKPPRSLAELYPPGHKAPADIESNFRRLYPEPVRQQEVITNLLQHLHKLEYEPRAFLYGDVNRLVNQLTDPQLTQNSQYRRLLKRITNSLGSPDMDDSFGAIFLVRYLSDNQKSIINGGKDPTFLNDLLETFSLKDIRRLANANPGLKPTTLLESLDRLSRSLDPGADVDLEIRLLMEEMIDDLGHLPTQQQLHNILVRRDELTRQFKRDQILELVERLRQGQIPVDNPLNELRRHMQRLRLQDPRGVITYAALVDSIDIERRIAQLMRESGFDPDSLIRLLHRTDDVPHQFASESVVYQFFRNKVESLATSLDQSFAANQLIDSVAQGSRNHFDADLLARWKALHDFILGHAIQVGENAFTQKRQLLGFIWEDIYLNTMLNRLGPPDKIKAGVMWSYHIRVKGANFDAVTLNHTGNTIEIEISDAKISNAPFSDKQKGVVPILEALEQATSAKGLRLDQLRTELGDGLGNGTGMSELLERFLKEDFGGQIPGNLEFRIRFRKVDSRE